jgi:NTP pyrophosphatase (non-canonical NTP hydrolase)
MNLETEFDSIRLWAAERGLYDKGDIKTQYLKLLEEVGELSRAIQDNNHVEIMDAIGDCVVVLTNLSYFANTNIEECINSAYNVIKDRKGSMINGTFVKDTI